MVTLEDLKATVERMEGTMADIQETTARQSLSLADWFAANMNEQKAPAGEKGE
jgi:hypothetical protein